MYSRTPNADFKRNNQDVADFCASLLLVWRVVLRMISFATRCQKTLQEGLSRPHSAAVSVASSGGKAAKSAFAALGIEAPAARRSLKLRRNREIKGGTNYQHSRTGVKNANC